MWFMIGCGKNMCECYEKELENIPEELRPWFIWVPLRDHKEVADAVLMEFKEVADQLGLTFYLTHGTCLGFVREGGYLEYDNDMDLVLHATLEEWKKMEKILLERGFIYSHSSRLSKNRIMIDVGCDWGDDERPYAYTVFDTVMYIGVKFNVPHPVEEYLVETYGEDWRIPKLDPLWRRYKEYVEKMRGKE